MHVLCAWQMEYCEKSTLRDTIDHGLHQDQNRLWRLFREILDGLAYIHQQVSICVCLCSHPLWKLINHRRFPQQQGPKLNHVFCCFNSNSIIVKKEAMFSFTPDSSSILLSFRAWFTGTWSLSTSSSTHRTMWRLETLAWLRTILPMWYVDNFFTLLTGWAVELGRFKM